MATQVNRAQNDGVVNDIDKQIDSVSPDDFNDSQLNDSSLGL
jgi:hypothetical protein